MMLKDNKLLRNVIIAVVTLGVLSGVYFWVTLLPNKVDEGAKTTDTTAIVFEIKKDDIAQVYVKNSNEDYSYELVSVPDETVDANGNKTIGEKTIWTIPKYKDLGLSQDAIDKNIGEYEAIIAEREVTKDISKKESYGITNNSNYCEITAKDGTLTRIVVGNKAPGDTSYYAFKEGGDTIYTISDTKIESLIANSDTFINKELAKINLDTISSFKMDKKGQKYIEVRDKVEGETTLNSAISNLIMAYPYKEAVGVDKFMTMLKDNFATITADKFINDDNLDKYGLKTPAYTLYFTYDNTTTVLNVGRVEGEGVYCTIDGKKGIFTIKSSIAKTLDSLTPFSIIEKYAHMVGMNDIKSVTVEGMGKKYDLLIERVKNGDTTDEIYSVNLKVAVKEAFSVAYQSIIGVMVTDEAKKQAGNTVVTVTFTYNDGSTKAISYKEYDDRNYVIDRGDSYKFITYKKNVDDMLNSLEKFDADPSQKP